MARLKAKVEGQLWDVVHGTCPALPLDVPFEPFDDGVSSGVFPSTLPSTELSTLALLSLESVPVDAMPVDKTAVVIGPGDVLSRCCVALLSRCSVALLSRCCIAMLSRCCLADELSLSLRHRVFVSDRSRVCAGGAMSRSLASSLASLSAISASFLAISASRSRIMRSAASTSA